MTLLMFNLYASKPTEVKLELDSNFSCVVPSYISKSTISKKNTITIGWDVITPAPKKYELLIVLKGKSPIISNTVFTNFSYANSISVSGLNFDTSFDAYVRSICDEKNGLVSSWSEKIQFKTFSLNNNTEKTSIGDDNADRVLEDTLKIYPNPATTKFRIQGPKVDKIELFNILGSKILEVRNTNTVNVSNLNTGAYLVKITANGNKVTKKLIITQ